jgi:hypothetical protein
VARSDDRTGRRRLYGLAGLLTAVAAVSGCSTTQDEAARLQLNSARIRASERHTVVHTAGRRLRVEHVSLISGPHGGSAFVVEVRNPGPRAIGDLPISIGVRRRHHARIDVNAHSAQELSYFASHLPTVGAGDSLTWVYTTNRSLPRGARPFALVGDRPSPAVTRVGAGTPPVIAARVLSRSPAGHGRSRLKISLHNTTTVPQYQLQVYAVGRRGDRALAAGALTVPHLGSHRTETASLPVIGPLAHVHLELAVHPTTFQ